MKIVNRQHYLHLLCLYKISVSNTIKKQVLAIYIKIKVQYIYIRKLDVDEWLHFRSLLLDVLKIEKSSHNPVR